MCVSLHVFFSTHRYILRSHKITNLFDVSNNYGQTPTTATQRNVLIHKHLNQNQNFDIYCLPIKHNDTITDHQMV